MTDMNSVLITLFADAEARSVLQEVAQSRWLRFGDLLTKGKAEVSRDAAKASVQKLRNLQLIDVKTSSIEDFDTVYITSDGLEASRKIAG